MSTLRPGGHLIRCRRQIPAIQTMMVAIPSLLSCEWEGFTNALIATDNVAATEVVTVTIATADKLTTAASQPLHNNKTSTLLKGRWTKRIGMNDVVAEEK
jgi:hypothetical protein